MKAGTLLGETSARAGVRPRRRRRPERRVLQLVAVLGVIGIGVAVAAIMSSQHSKGWLVGLVVSLVTLALTVVVQWASRRL